MVSSTTNEVKAKALNGAVHIDAEDIAHLTGVKGRFKASPRLELGAYTYKCAETEDELNQVHRLNYRTFVDEIGQYPANDSEQLVDKFHDKNRYFIAVRDGVVVGMIAAHDQPPFSVADRLTDPTILARLGSRLMEVRLLAIEPTVRYGPVFRGLLWLLYEYGVAHGYSHLIISGISERTRLYERIGFSPLGPAMRCGEASFVPMAMSLGSVPENIRRDAERLRSRLLDTTSATSHGPVSFLPGPVHASDEVRAAVAQRPVSHRGPHFIERFERIRAILADLSGGLEASILVGSGTLANEVVGATLAADRSLRRGLVLVNGEFGRRLATQAARYAMPYDTLNWQWGQRWNLDQVREALDRQPDINWVWAVHLETSTGLVNDIGGLLDVAESRSIKVSLDCVSSLGALETNISRAHLATCVSGKSIGALAGLAFVLARQGALEHVDASRVPTYLDLKETMRTIGPRFTVSSPVLHALDCAIAHYATREGRQERFANYADLGRYVRRRLRALGFTPLIDGPDAAPVITSFTPPKGIPSKEFCEICLSWGYEISGLSGYLLDRGMVQIATMGAVTQRDCAHLFAKIRSLLKERGTLTEPGDG